MGWRFRRPIYSLRHLHEISGFRLVDARYKLLWISIDDRKPRALYLHHDPVSLEKHVIVASQWNFVLGNAVRNDCLRLFKTIPEPRAHNFGGNDQFVSVQTLRVLTRFIG